MMRLRVCQRGGVPAAMLALLFGAATTPAAIAMAPTHDPQTAAVATPSVTAPDLAALIECRAGVADYAAVVGLFTDPDAAQAQGLQPLPSSNRFMSEYRLATPLNVFGQQSQHIAVAGGSLMAVLAVPDPRPLARRLRLEIGYDADGKFMAGREVVSRDIVAPATGEAMIESVILSLSTVSTHPGQTLAGCTYSLDEPESAAATDGAPSVTPAD